MEMIGRLKERIEQGYRLGYDEALELLRTTPETELCALAHALRTRYQGKTIDMCSIMNARSGRCSEDCKWCAQSKFHKTEVEVYPLVGAREAVEEAAGNARKGVKRFSLVTSGRTLSDADTDWQFWKTPAPASGNRQAPADGTPHRGSQMPASPAPVRWSRPVRCARTP